MRATLGYALAFFAACQLGNAAFGQESLGKAQAKPVTVTLSELPGLRYSWKKIEFEGPPKFDASGQFLCLTAHTWTTNADFSENLHYVIINLQGAVQTSSESTPATNLLAKFPDLAMMVFHRGLISRDDHTNMFLDPGRWVVATDLSWCVRVRQMADLSDLVEKFALKPTVEKKSVWTYKGNDMPPSCQMSYVVLGDKDVIAISRSFREIVLLDVATGSNVDVIPYGPGRGIVNLSLGSCIIPQRECLVCDEPDSKRIRVISLGPTHSILKEVGEKGINGLGVWSTPRLEAAAEGQLLLRVSEWGSRLLGGKKETEIYDTGAWKVLWRRVERGGKDIALSPDGRRLAIQHGQTLEIRPFLAK